MSKSRYPRIWFLLALIAAIRFEVGTDYPNYVNLFYDIRDGFQSYLHMEPFHLAVNEFALYAEFGPQFIFFVYAVLTTLFFVLFFYKMSNTFTDVEPKLIFALCTILYLGNYYFLSLNSIRSCLAASLYVLGLYYYTQRRSFLTILIFSSGCFIHFSMIPIALITLLSLAFIFPLKRKTFIAFVTIILLNPLSLVAYIFVNYKLMYYNYFLSDTYAVPATFIGQLSAYGSVALALLFYYFFMKKIGIKDNRTKGIFQLSIILFIAFRIFSNELFIFARLSRYLSPVLYLFTAYSIAYFIKYKIADNSKSLALLGFVVFLTITNIIMFVPRGLEDDSYGNYKINYCILSNEICDVSIDTRN
ncbi:EpsG family protein [Enterobacter mori]